jgi:outer membrane lipase/esterase
VNSYQFGIYGAWADAHFFAQGLATFGWQNFRNTRPGVVDTITSNPDGTTFVAGGKVGYLFDAGTSQVGPIGGLTYARARVNGYTESGDPVLTLTVGPQTAETLVASAGVQFRTSFMVNGRIISPYLNLTAEDDLIGNGRIIQFGATSVAADHQQLGDPQRYLAICLRARSGRRCCAGDEQCGADGESFPNRGSSGRQ